MTAPTNLIWLVLLIPCGIIAAVIAAKKGRNEVGWFVMGLFLGPLGIILAAVISKDKEAMERSAVQRGEMKKCSECAEAVRLEAVKCRYCGAGLAVKSGGSDVSASPADQFLSGEMRPDDQAMRRRYARRRDRRRGEI